MAIGYAGEHERMVNQKAWDIDQSNLQQSPRLRASNTRAAPRLAQGPAQRP
jgi:hypothetical protein